MGWELKDEIERSWGLRYFNKKKFRVRYCYTIYLDGDGSPLEKVCDYKSPEDARRALEERIRQLQQSGLYCSQSSRDQLGPIYTCQGTITVNNTTLWDATLVARIDVEKKPILKWRLIP